MPPYLVALKGKREKSQCMPTKIREHFRGSRKVPTRADAHSNAAAYPINAKGASEYHTVYISIGVQTKNDGTCITFLGLPPHAKGKSVTEGQMSLEMEIQVLKKELGEAQERLGWLEEDNIRVRSLAGVYRGLIGISEAHRAGQHGSLDAPIISQARWTSSPPDGSCGTHLGW